MMEFYKEQATEAIQEYINKLRQLGYTVDVSLSFGPLGSPPVVFIYVRSHISKAANTCGIQLLGHANKSTG